MDDEHLGLVLQAAERRRVQDAIPIPLESCAVPGFILGIFSSLGILAA